MAASVRCASSPSCVMPSTPTAVAAKVKPTSHFANKALDINMDTLHCKSTTQQGHFAYKALHNKDTLHIGPNALNIKDTLHVKH